MPAAIVRQCAILTGGLGTRLGTLTGSVPKPLLRCGDRPFLAWLMREFIRFGVDDFLLLTGHLSEVVEAALPELASFLPKPVRIACAREPLRAGTGGALFHARDRLVERFLLCNGDSLIDFNLARLLADAAQDGDDVAGRMVLRRLDNASRYGVVETVADRVAAFRERPAEGAAGTINAGLYLFDRRVLDHTEPVCSLERDVLPRLAEEGVLRGTVGNGYFIDIGIPADLERAQTELPRLLHRRAMFLDRDGVINVNHGWVGTRERFEWIPGALDAIAAAANAGFHVFVVTNQSGVARGYYDEAQFAALNDWMIGEIRAHGGTVDDVRYCPFHPEAMLDRYRKDSDWRKPGPGMLLDLVAKWEIDTARSLMVGDQPSDLAAAAAAKITAHHFRGGNLLEFIRPLIGKSDLCGMS